MPLPRILSDVRFSLRSLSRAPGFTIAVVLMLAVGIAVGAVVYSLASGILFAKSPFPDANHLFIIGTKDPRGANRPYQFVPQLKAYEEQVDAFSEYAAVTRESANILIDREVASATVIEISPQCFKTLAMHPRLGRSFSSEEYRAGANNVVIITHTFWQEHFKGDEAVIGRQIYLNREPCTVVGVWPRGQSFPPTFDGEVYRPLVLKVDPANPLSPAVFVLGHLRHDVTEEQAVAALASAKLPPIPAWAAPYLGQDQKPTLISLHSFARRESFAITLAAAGLLYAVACCNATNLLIVRLLRRRGELAIRGAIGATTWDVLRLLVTEIAIIVFAASLAVFFASRWLFPPVFELLTGNAKLRHVEIWSGTTALGILALGLFAGLAMVVTAVIRCYRGNERSDRNADLSSVRGSWFSGAISNSLIALQAGIAVVLLSGAGLMAKSFATIEKTDYGFNHEGKVKLQLTIPADYKLEGPSRTEFFDGLKRRLALIPGIRGVTYGQDTLMIGNVVGNTQIRMADGSLQNVASAFVGPDFASTSGLRVLRGRWLSDRRNDYEVVVNQSFARLRFGTTDPVGQSFKVDGWGDYAFPIVGVVNDVRDGVRAPAGPRFYLPAWIAPQTVSTFILRLDSDPSPEFYGLVRRVLYDADPRLIVGQIASLNEIVGNMLWAERYTYKILTTLAALALVLAVSGIFATAAYHVDSRMREFGIRLALGADRRNLRALVLYRGLKPVTIGILAGILVALASTHFMQSLLVGIGSNDPVVFMAGAVIMMVAAAIGCWEPARRASSADPSRLLQSE